MHANEYRQNFGKYFGVDRLPPFITPDSEIRKLLGEPLVEDLRLRNALKEWFDAQGDKNAFIANRDKAFRLLESFQSLGFRLELIYCQIAWQSGEEDRLADYAAVEEPPLVVSHTYGFDVSWPTCNHSAILQPGVVQQNKPWRERLNEWGLLNYYNEAVRLREEYILVYPYRPFDIYLVHKVE